MASVMESTMGTIRAMAAVLEIHMDRNMVTDMKPEMRMKMTFVSWSLHSPSSILL